VIDDVAVFPDDLIVMDGMIAKEITRIPVAGAFRERFGQPYALVHRADLHRALLDRCSEDPLVELRSDSTVTGHSECPDGVTVSGESDAPRSRDLFERGRGRQHRCGERGAD
jgi:2-polyprenyl-6-methoxyphenol hydroxylase-like FAD-dependent oxidoreductase